MTGPRLRIVARIGLPRSPHGSFVLISLGAHVLFLVALLLVPALRPKPSFDDSYFVQLAPALPGKSSPAPAVPAPPAPAPQETPDEGVRVSPVEPKKAEPKEKKPKPEPKPEPEKPVVQQTAPPSEAAADPDPASLGGPPQGEIGDGEGRIEGEIGDEALAWYRSSVTSALYSNWQRPILSGNLTTLEVTVEFEIQRDGIAARLRITAPSGVPSLDRSALRAVADASPLPPLPAQWKDATLPARFVFQLHPEEF